MNHMAVYYTHYPLYGKITWSTHDWLFSSIFYALRKYWVMCPVKGDGQNKFPCFVFFSRLSISLEEYLALQRIWISKVGQHFVLFHTYMINQVIFFIQTSVCTWDGRSPKGSTHFAEINPGEQFMMFLLSTFHLGELEKGSICTQTVQKQNKSISRPSTRWYGKIMLTEIIHTNECPTALVFFAAYHDNIRWWFATK